MAGMHATFNDLDAKMLTWLVDRFDDSGATFDEQELASAIGVAVEDVRSRLSRFHRFQMIERLDRGGNWQVQPQLLSVAEQLSAPKLEPDRIEEAQKWFRRQWWSVPVWIAITVVPLVILPAVVGWITILTYLTSLFAK